MGLPQEVVQNTRDKETDQKKMPKVVRVMCYIFSPLRRICTVSQVTLAVRRPSTPVKEPQLLAIEDDDNLGAVDGSSGGDDVDEANSNGRARGKGRVDSTMRPWPPRTPRARSKL